MVAGIATAAPLLTLALGFAAQCCGIERPLRRRAAAAVAASKSSSSLSSTLSSSPKQRQLVADSDEKAEAAGRNNAPYFSGGCGFVANNGADDEAGKSNHHHHYHAAIVWRLLETVDAVIYAACNAVAVFFSFHVSHAARPVLDEARSEHNWGFGQIVAIIMVLAPVLALFNVLIRTSILPPSRYALPSPLTSSHLPMIG
jgi:hypothetical protein